MLRANRTNIRDGPFCHIQRLQAAKEPHEVYGVLSKYQDVLSCAYELLVRVPHISLLALSL